MIRLRHKGQLTIPDAVRRAVTLQEGEREVSEDISAGRTTRYARDDAFLDSLD